jgi:predicted O-linked N-acetylglucosamine transferase (SPINDLY family)
MDYVISDGVVTPQDAIENFSEKIIYMPNCFQVSDRKRIMSEKTISKKDFGLPDIGFIYCCFNNIYKITPEVFDSWMRILNNVNGSVL